VSRRAYGWAAALGLVVLAGAAWWLLRPRVVEPGQPLPLGKPVEMHFREEGTGESEVWKLEKKTTTREEALGTVVLPKPDPDAAKHQPNESARALDGLGLQAWRESDLPRALQQFEAAIAADPDDRVPRSHYGRLLMLMIDYDAALPQLERAAELAPEDPQVWLDLQSLYERAQRLDQSWQARAQAETLTGGRPIVQDEQGLYKVENGPDWSP
jgi:tetratricopeptide (TPR) repeat protein